MPVLELEQSLMCILQRTFPVHNVLLVPSLREMTPYLLQKCSKMRHLRDASVRRGVLSAVRGSLLGGIVHYTLAWRRLKLKVLLMKAMLCLMLDLRILPKLRSKPDQAYQPEGRCAYTETEAG